MFCLRSFYRSMISAPEGSRCQPQRPSLYQPPCSSETLSKPCILSQWVCQQAHNNTHNTYWSEFFLTILSSSSFYTRNPPSATKIWWQATKTKWSSWQAASRKEKSNWWWTSSSRCWTASSEERWRRRRPNLQRFKYRHSLLFSLISPNMKK